MKHSFTVLTLTILGAGVAAWAAGQGSESASIDSPKPAAPIERSAAVARTEPGEVSGNQLMKQAVREVTHLSSIEAKLRMSTNLLGQELVGSGHYCQLARENETLLKMELKLQVANQVSSMLQVSDGRFLWVRRDLPQRKTLSRIDQRRVRDAVAKSKQPPLATPGTNWMALGGLGKLMEGLESNFDFTSVKQDQIGSAPVWVLQGSWKPTRLAILWPQEAANLVAGKPVDLAQLPAHLPQRVLVVVSRDNALPLFPYRVEYQRVGRAGELEPIMALDLFEIRRNGALDPKQFAYKPGDQEVGDETEAYLAGLGLK